MKNRVKKDEVLFVVDENLDRKSINPKKFDNYYEENDELLCHPFNEHHYITVDEVEDETNNFDDFEIEEKEMFIEGATLIENNRVIEYSNGRIIKVTRIKEEKKERESVEESYFIGAVSVNENGVMVPGFGLQEYEEFDLSNYSNHEIDFLFAEINPEEKITNKRYSKSFSPDWHGKLRLKEGKENLKTFSFSKKSRLLRKKSRKIKEGIMIFFLPDFPDCQPELFYSPEDVQLLDFNNYNEVYEKLSEEYGSESSQSKETPEFDEGFWLTFFIHKQLIKSMEYEHKILMAHAEKIINSRNNISVKNNEPEDDEDEKLFINFMCTDIGKLRKKNRMKCA
ncbi:MAG: hypothetical protein MUF50_04160 [Planctomycetes bacterium]|jgi:hypothetical protein|nr:hypothetical protein [Planctomycetota bacterium]